MFIHLHTRSWFSFLRGGSSPEALVRRASSLGMTSLALTDYMSMSGVVEFQVACRRFGLRPIIGAEIDTGEDLFVLLARNRGGYTNVCEIITWLERQDEEALRQGRLRERVGRTLKRYGEDVICLAGGRESVV